MSPLAVMVGSLLVLMALKVPIAFAMGISSLAYILVSGTSLRLLAQYLIVNLDSFTLLAIPFFVLAGELMVRGGVAQRLIDVAKVMVGHVRGGLGQVNVMTSCIFATMSGSASADAAATSRILVPAMQRDGYSRGFASAITAASATVGPIIPPSIHLVLVGAINELSIGRLFLAGIVPGLLMVGGMMILVFVGARRSGVAASPRATLPDVWCALRRGVFPMLTPVIILGGIFGGIFTPTEAAVIAVVYAFVVGKVVYRELTWTDTARSLLGAVDISARIMFIVALAGIFGWILSSEQAAHRIAAWMQGFAESPVTFLLLANLFLLFMGMFINLVTLLILLSPIFFPMLGFYGIDPIHFGVVMVLNLMIGQLTPPVGLMSFVVMSVTETPLEKFLAAVWPLVLVLVAVLLLITYVPGLALWLPNLVMGNPG
jgi:C4-dicarboxylate transporter, DctM subunit